VAQHSEDLSQVASCLEVLVEGQIAEVIQLRKKVVKIGRAAEADIQLMDSEISSLHCRLEWVKGTFLVFDCQSTNGTFVNGQKILKSTLKRGDEIKVGKSLFRYSESKKTDIFDLEKAFEAEQISGLALKERDKIMELLTARSAEILKNQRLHFIGSWADGTKSEIKVDSRSETVGRACDLGHFALDSELSRKHLSVSLDDKGNCYVEDLESLNGSFVNEVKISEKTKVEKSDLVRIGGTEFRVMIWVKKM
jgi:pSer/pThr/pTyr-binding forkhead associated (FHA) protein